MVDEKHDSEYRLPLNLETDGGINKQFPKREKKAGLSGKRTRETMDNIK